jgi:hypothetical protein
VKPADVGRYHAEHNLDGLLLIPPRCVHEGNGESGLRTINEMRRLDNMPPLPGGDVAMRQAQYPITELGSTKAPQ